MRCVALFAVVVAVASAAYFTEDFSGDWESNWVQSKFKSDFGKFVAANGGIKTSEDAHNYAFSSKFDTFSNANGKLIVQFSVKHGQDIDCGGGYVKIFPSTADQKQIHAGDNETPYNIMFGPDICGPGHKKVHVIFEHKGKNLQTKKNIACKSDTASHLYTLTVDSVADTYQVDIDGSKVESGSLFEDFDFLEPKQINDPAQSKPSDWVDVKQIADPSDSKPSDWEQPETIVDDKAETPEDWDEEADGAWEAPTIANPAYKGEWKAKMIPNPAYKGEWVHPQVDNPKFVDDKEVATYADFGILGLDLWQVKAGTTFDNFLLTNNADEAAAGVKSFNAIVKAENEAKAAADKAEAEAKAAADAASKESTEDAEEETEAKDEL